MPDTGPFRARAAAIAAALALVAIPAAAQDRSEGAVDEACAAELREQVGAQVPEERLNDLIAARCDPSAMGQTPQSAGDPGPPASPVYGGDAGETVGPGSEDVEIEEGTVEEVPPEAVPSPGAED